MSTSTAVAGFDTTTNGTAGLSGITGLFADPSTLRGEVGVGLLTLHAVVRPRALQRSR